MVHPARQKRSVTWKNKRSPSRITSRPTARRAARRKLHGTAVRQGSGPSTSRKKHTIANAKRQVWETCLFQFSIYPQKFDIRNTTACLRAAWNSLQNRLSGNLPSRYDKKLAAANWICSGYCFIVVPPGIEPGTQGFSVLCSTNWAMAPSALNSTAIQRFTHSPFAPCFCLFVAV